MMETLLQPLPYPSSVKSVLQKYQRSATNSLQGPSLVFGVSPKTEETKVTESVPEPFPPLQLAIQQTPILSEPDTRGEFCTTILEGEVIHCFRVGGEERLCLPQILNTLLSNFSVPTINGVCDKLQIYCSRCNAGQIEALKAEEILPSSAPGCGLITKTDAERLCSALLHRGLPSLSDRRAGYPSFKVYHECFGKEICEGIFTPALAPYIECIACNHVFTPQQFVCHTHDYDHKTCHWGFDSSKWRAYLLASRKQSGFEFDYDGAVKQLAVLKEKDSPGVPSLPAKRKTPPAKSPTPSGIVEPDEDEVVVKKAKSEELSPPTPDTTRSHNGKVPELEEEAALLKIESCKDYADVSVFPFVQYPDPLYFNYIETFRASSSASAFRPYSFLPCKDGKHPILRDSVPQPVPTYLNRDPPKLLHPDRVVPHSESERFESSFQPNVALAPPLRHRPKAEPTETQVKCEPDLRDDEKTELEVEVSVTSEPAMEPDSSDKDRARPEPFRSRNEMRMRAMSEWQDMKKSNGHQHKDKSSRMFLFESILSELEEENKRLKQEMLELRRIHKVQAEQLTTSENKVTQLLLRLQAAESALPKSDNCASATVPLLSSPVSVITTSPPALVIKTEPAE